MRLHEILKEETVQIGDHFDLELDDLVIETVVVDLTEDGVVIEADDTTLSYLSLDEGDKPRLASFNDRPRRIGPGSSPDDYQYTKYTPKGKEAGEKWAVAADVAQNNLRLAATKKKKPSTTTDTGFYKNYLSARPPRGESVTEVVESDISPKLIGMSFKEIDSLCEHAGANYNKFNQIITKKLNLPSWYNTMELFGIYLRKLNAGGNSLKEDKLSSIEQKLFNDLEQRSSDSIKSASVGDKVSLLHLSTLNIPGHKIIAKLNGFLNPKEIAKITDYGSYQQLEFVDGSKYPENDENLFQMTQTWNMTKLFPTKESASKIFTIYGLIGEKMSDKLDFEINVDVKPNKSVDEGPADEPVEPDMDADDKRWDDMDEAKYQGREVPLGKPMAGDVKKSKVYVRKPNGKVVKVNFGDKKMRIKKSNPERRKSFRARHNCKNPGPRWKARYWSCRAW